MNYEANYTNLDAGHFPISARLPVMFALPCIINFQNGETPPIWTLKVSLLESCPHFRGVLLTLNPPWTHKSVQSLHTSIRRYPWRPKGSTVPYSFGESFCLCAIVGNSAHFVEKKFLPLSPPSSSSSTRPPSDCGDKGGGC